MPVSARKLGAHAASLGMHFIHEDAFSQQYRNVIFIAEHGLWNKTIPDGYRMTHVELKDKLAVNYEVFAENWLNGAKRLGRPVDVLKLQDGSLLVLDNHANCIYRTTYLN